MPEEDEYVTKDRISWEDTRIIGLSFKNVYYAGCNISLFADQFSPFLLSEC